MTIDEAIAKLRSNAIIDKYNMCGYSMEQHEQVAEWLEELKEYKKNSNTCPMCDTYCSCIAEEFENGYNKAIDDFVEKIQLKYLGVHPDELYEKYYPREICLQVKEMAERLKAGVKYEM